MGQPIDQGDPMTSPPRRLPRARVALAAAAVACIVTLGGAVMHSSAASRTEPVRMNMHGMVTGRQLAFRNQMRMLWEEHVTWTRLSIVSFAGGLPDLAPTEQRLLRNQTDIGDAIKPFYGQTARKALTGLLRRHILTAVQILIDVKANDKPALTADLKSWYHNANQIAAFLHRANPHNWPLRDLRHMMHRHLALTTQEAVAQLSGKYPASVRAYDRVEHEILGMADMLSTGIIAQFPSRFR
jgi:hypothetical protein